MFETDAYAFLDVDNPFCAWATYRGALVCAPERPGFLSAWTAGLIRAGNAGRISFESAMEDVRLRQFPNRISRLRGMFCMPDAESAMRACSWNAGNNSHFQPEFLAELSLSEAGPRRDRLDANWITFAPTDMSGYLTDFSWISNYWEGSPYPGKEPIWEILVDGRLWVIGTDIRDRAYSAVRTEFPDSLMFLEIARQAVRIGSDLGSISAFTHTEANDLVLDYCLNMEDANSPELHRKLHALKESGHPINFADMKPHIDRESFGNVPDFRPYGFRRPIRTVFRSPL
jgi:hypothetical protein